MQDSIQLPNQDLQFKSQQKQINFFVSPNNSQRKFKRQGDVLQLAHTGSQQSLAYSSQTLAKYIYTQRSPIQIQIPNFDTSCQKSQKENKKSMIKAGKNGNGSKGYKYANTVNISNTVNNNNPAKQLTLKQTHSESYLDVSKIQQSSPAAGQDRRKTISQKDFANMSKKYKQLEYAHQIQLLNSEQLRTKVAILTELLEQKFKESEFAYFLKFKNSSKNLSNVDIFMQLREANRRNKEYQLIIQDMKTQLQKYRQLYQQSQNKPPIQPSLPLNKPDPQLAELHTKLQQLTEQKQSLFNYIQQLREQYNIKQTQNEQLTKQLKLCREKQESFVNKERAKFVQEITQRSNLVRELREQLQRVGMERNLMELDYEERIQEIKKSHITQKHQIQNKYSSLPKQTAQQSTNTPTPTPTQSPTQTDLPDPHQQLLKSQLLLLKSQRDYYIKQYKKRLAQGSQNYLLRVQLRAFKGQSCQAAVDVGVEGTVDTGADFGDENDGNFMNTRYLRSGGAKGKGEDREIFSYS